MQTYWENPTPANRHALRQLQTLETTRVIGFVVGSKRGEFSSDVRCKITRSLPLVTNTG